MYTLWTTIFYQPIYNALIFLIDTITLGDVGFAIIILTIIVKLILFPLAKKSIKSQLFMKRLEPELKALKKKYPNKEEHAKKQFELYKKYGVNPFSGCLVLLLQLPIIIALYWVFVEFALNTSLIYSFVGTPQVFNTNFLGIINLPANHNIILAILVGVSQFIQLYLVTPIKPKVEVVKGMPEPEVKTFQEELGASMQTNMKYTLPVLVAVFAYSFSAAVALYWITSNIFTIGQEWYVRRSVSKTSLPITA